MAGGGFVGLVGIWATLNKPSTSNETKMYPQERNNKLAWAFWLKKHLRQSFSLLPRGLSFIVLITKGRPWDGPFNLDVYLDEIVLGSRGFAKHIRTAEAPQSSLHPNDESTSCVFFKNRQYIRS
jgi:hypothetical protein